ncbi:hypothetical protein FOYG_13661 [Fusarium oxysporum NRRL 32931]|uniref:Uncharacterized protein n=1 Tax=Fusarium oxysporum NRRL 32931 TaxID=660029 RepID=W9HNK4_FUSOX|nr:hypothetical protein FOYG_13661 [Fusarium oxysporum NRRL 32931]
MLRAVFGSSIKTGEGLFEAFRWLSETVESRMKYDTGINEKVPLYDEEEEATRIIMEGLQPCHKEEISEKRE